MKNFKCTGRRIENGVEVYEMEYTGEKGPCPRCSSRRITNNNILTRRLISLNEYNEKIILETKIPRQLCLACKKTWFPHEILRQKPYTEIYKNEIVKRAVFEEKKMADVGRELGCSYTSVRNTVNAWFENQERRRFYHTQERMLFYDTEIRGEVYYLVIGLDRVMLLDIVHAEEPDLVRDEEKLKEILTNTSESKERLEMCFPDVTVKTHNFFLRNEVIEVLADEGKELGLRKKALRAYLKSGAESRIPKALSDNPISLLPVLKAFNHFKKNRNDVSALKSYDGVLYDFGNYLSQLSEEETPTGFTAADMEYLDDMVGTLISEIRRFGGRNSAETIRNHLLYNELTVYPEDGNAGFGRLLRPREAFSKKS